MDRCQRRGRPFDGVHKVIRRADGTIAIVHLVCESGPVLRLVRGGR